MKIIYYFCVNYLNMNCIVCNDKLNGNRKKFCSNNCKSKFHYKNSNGYYIQTKRGYNRKLKLIEIKGGGCVKCGYNKNISALEFHHIDETIKAFAIDRRTLSNNSMETILKEAEKCILLCANCHREHHNPECDIEAVNVFVNNTPYKESREVKTGTDCKVCGTNFKKITGKIYCSKSCREKDKR